MKSSRYITRSSGAWLHTDAIASAFLTPAPASRYASTSSAPAPAHAPAPSPLDHSPSRPSHYHGHTPTHHLQSRTITSGTARAPPPSSSHHHTHHNPPRTSPAPSDPDPCNFQSFHKRHRDIWKSIKPGREAVGQESKRRLNAASNGISRGLVAMDVPRTETRCLDDWSTEWGWKRALRKVRSGTWHYQPSSALSSALLRCRTVDEVRGVWEEARAAASADETAADADWAPVMLTLLASDMRQACLFLQASFPLSDPPLYALSDSVAYVDSAIETGTTTTTTTTTAAAQREEEGPPLTDYLCDAVIYLLREHPERESLLGKDVLKLLRQVGPDRLAELYDALCGAQVSLGSYTLMHIASGLGKEPRLKRMALEVMAVGLARIRHGPGAERDNAMMRRRWDSVFTTILSSARISVTNQEAVSPEEIWDFAVENGITPNTIQLTALVQGLCATGQVDAAWRAFDMFAEERGDMPVDLKLSSTLLQGSKLSGSLPHILRALALVAETRHVDARVGNNILHLVLSLALSDRLGGVVPASFPLMLRIYSRMFRPEDLEAMVPERLRRDVVNEDDASLEDVILLPDFVSSLDAMFPGHADALLQPTPVTLEIMVLSWICSLRKGSKSTALIAFYGHYRGMLQDRHPVAAGMVKARNSVIHDMIIKAMSSSPAHLRAALEVIADMLRDYEATGALPAADPLAAAASPPPPLFPPREEDDATSGIRQADADGAVQDRQNQAEAPVHPRPSTWTWNILLDAWMRHYRQDNAGRIVSLMKRHGVEPSLVTWNTILSRAAQARNTQLAVMSAQEIREGGFEPDEWTVRAFSKLVEKEMFLSEIQGEGGAREEEEG